MVVLSSNHKYKGEDACKTPHLTEDEIKAAFVLAFNRLLANREQWMAEYMTTIAELADTAAFDEKIARLQIEYAEAVAKAQDLFDRNARAAQDDPERSE